MTFSRPRSGVFATVNGREYAVESVSDNGVVVLSGDELGDPQVATGDCERLDEVTTWAKYLGYECQVVAIEDDGSVGLYYLGPDKSKAIRDGFVQIEGGVLAKTVNVYDLASLWEQHTDLLFSQWLNR
jgi:hypothetical protein